MNIKQEEEHHHAGAFYIDDNGRRMGEIRYLVRNGVMNIYHTEVNPELKGMNMGFKLVEAGVKYAREAHVKVLPTCPFANAVFKKTPEFGDVLAVEA
jgi:hypothetical protein